MSTIGSAASCCVQPTRAEPTKSAVMILMRWSPRLLEEENERGNRFATLLAGHGGHLDLEAVEQHGAEACAELQRFLRRLGAPEETLERVIADVERVGRSEHRCATTNRERCRAQEKDQLGAGVVIDAVVRDVVFLRQVTRAVD